MICIGAARKGPSNPALAAPRSSVQHMINNKQTTEKELGLLGIGSARVPLDVRSALQQQIAVVSAAVSDEP